MPINIYTDNEDYLGICREYWEISSDGAFLKTVANIAKDYRKKSAEINNIVKSNCSFFSEDLFCDSCQSPYQFENRTDYLRRDIFEKWTCKNCESHMSETELETKYSFVALIAEEAKNNNIDPREISARHLVALAALSRFSANESLTHIKEFDSVSEMEFSPSREYSLDILKELYASKLLIVSPTSDLNKIILNENVGYSFFINEVQFILPHPDPSGLIATIEDYLLSASFLSENQDELKIFAKEIALQECLEYLKRVLSDHQLQYSPGEKTFLVLKKGLENYAVAQMCNFIWRAAKDAAAFYVRNRVSKDHAAKTVVANIERQIERALANDWNVAAYRRNYSHPQSVISRTLYNIVLGTDDGGFSTKISSLFHEPNSTVC